VRQFAVIDAHFFSMCHPITQVGCDRRVTEHGSLIQSTVVHTTSLHFFLGGIACSHEKRRLDETFNLALSLQFNRW